MREGVEDLGGGKFLVESGSNPGAYYRVDVNEPSCQCKGFEHRGGCKHLNSLASEVPEPKSLPTLYTSRYQNESLGRVNVACVRTSVGEPKFPVNFEYDSLMVLYPPRYALKMEGEEFIFHCRAHLERAGVKFIGRALEVLAERNGGKPLVLLCYEDVTKGELCHRRVFAEWWEEKTGQKVHEWEGEPKGEETPESTLF